MARKYFSDGEFGVSIVVDDAEMLRASGWDEARDIAAEMSPGHSPFLIERGDRVALDLESDSVSDVISSLDPGRDLAAEVEEYAEGVFLEMEWERPPFDAGNEIDGVRWGWFSEVWGTPTSLLVPQAFQANAWQVARISGFFSGSMTGAVIDSGYKHDDLVGMTWWYADDASPTTFITIAYERPDPITRAQSVIAAPFQGGEPSCGECQGKNGWDLKIEVAPAIPLDAAGSAIATFWRPCDEHAHTWQPELAGHRWHWAGDTWTAS